VQLAATFGHIHREDLVPIARQGPSASSGLAHVSSDRPNQPAQPADHDDSSTHDVCTICASIALAGSLLIPEPPAVSVAIARHPTWVPDRATAVLRDRQRPEFQARGPPV